LHPAVGYSDRKLALPPVGHAPDRPG
jgi:hypothetical protein